MFLRSVALASMTLACLAPAHAQSSAPKAESAKCLSAADIKALDLYGNWVVEIASLDGAQILHRGRIELEKNPEHADSVSGWMHIQDQKIFVAGDMDAGAFSFEESDDGTRISAVWEGAVADGSCGKAITGMRRAGELQTRFVMRRATGWN